MKITETALRFKTTVYVLILSIFIIGMNSYMSLPLESSPDVEVPIIIVSVVYPGVSPEDIEKLVTNPMERKLKELKNVKELTSTSSESVSILKIEFETDMDMDEAYQKVRDKVDQAKPDLPDDVEDPVLTEINISEFPIMLVNLSGDYGLDKLKKVGEDLEDAIEQIPGVLNVDLVGGLEREIQVLLDPVKLEYYKIGVGLVISRIQEEHLTTPGGNIELGGSKYLVRIPGEYRDVSQMNDIVLKAIGERPIKISDVGKVIDGYEDRDNMSRVNGKECVTLRVEKRSGENIIEVADAVRDMLKEYESTFPTGTEWMIRQDQSKHVRDMVKDLENSIISGLILVLLVLFFSMGLRNSFFVAIAIPLSMLITFITLRALGITLNMVVLFSLILALGMLVDNSIVVVENIFRHASEGLSRERAALTATKEVAWPIISSSATTIACFAPMIFWPGIMGDFMSFLPKTVIVALLASLFVALVINPVIAANFLSKKSQKLFDDSGEATSGILKYYQKVLEWSLNRPIRVIFLGVVVLCSVFVLYGAFGAGVEFFPTTTPERGQVKIKAPQGTALERTDALMHKVENLVLKQDNLEDIIANVGFEGGKVMLDTGGGNTHVAVADLEFKDRHERTHSTWETVESIREDLKHLAGAEFSFELEAMGPPTGSPVEVEISGPDYVVSNRYARLAKEILGTVEGVVDIKDDFDAGKPEIKIDIDREKAKIRKLNTAMISNAVRTAINGTVASVLREGEDEYDIVVRYDEAHRRSMEDLLDIVVTGKDDVQVPLRDVATVRTSGGLGSIKHIDQKRTILVSADVMGRSSSEVLIEVKKLFAEKLKLPAGYTFHFGGESEEQDKAAAFLSEAFTIGLMLMALILITQFNSVLRPFIILFSVVMSLIGVFLGLLITQNKFGIMMTGMGVISLAGVVVNNAIVLIDYTNQLREKHGFSLRDSLLRAGMVRFRPVLLTAVTTALGMLPMALGVSIDFTSLSVDIGASSGEWWGPMARAVIFGLLFATVLTLVLIPVMYQLQEQATGLFSILAGKLRGKTEDRSVVSDVRSDS